MSKTSDQLLAGVKRRCIVPSSQVLLSDADFFLLADDIISSRVVPLILGMRQDYFVTVDSESLVADTSSYSIPERSIARGLRDLKLNDTSSDRDLTLIAAEDSHFFDTNTGTPHSFYFKGDKIIVVPTPGASDTSLTLQKWYNLKHSRLTAVSNAALVTSKTSTTVTVSAAPSGITTATAVDFIQGTSGNSILAMDKTPTIVAGTTYTFAAGAIPTSLVAGDYLSLAQTTPVLMIPDEAYPYTETLIARRLLNIIGDFDGAQRLAEDEREEEKNLKQIMEPRVMGENTLIINRRGLLRGTRQRYRKTMTV